MSTGTLTGPRPGTTSTRPASRDTGTRRPTVPTRAATASPTRTADTRASGIAPFVLLIMVLLTGGLVATLWLSTAAAADSYRLDEARQVARDLSEQSERLHRDVEAAQSAPALAAAARAQGMVPAGEPAVLVIAPDGSSQVVGDPKPAQAVAPPPPVAVPATPPAQNDGAQNNGAQAATDGQPAPAPAGAAAAEDQLVAVPDATPDTTPDPANSETTPDSAAAA
ncbi:hypothetical protein ACFPEL_13085, partial [Actinomycetospora chibensis]